MNLFERANVLNIFKTLCVHVLGSAGFPITHPDNLILQEFLKNNSA